MCVGALARWPRWCTLDGPADASHPSPYVMSLTVTNVRELRYFFFLSLSLSFARLWENVCKYGHGVAQKPPSVECVLFLCVVTRCCWRCDSRAFPDYFLVRWLGMWDERWGDRECVV